MPIVMRNPFGTGVSLGTNDLLGIPIHLKLREIKGIWVFGLPELSRAIGPHTVTP